MLVVVAVVSLIPAPEDLGGSDKLFHFVAYAGLSFGFALLAQTRNRLLLAASGLVAYGIVLEVLQGFTGYRQMESLDMLANSLGVLAGLPLWWTSVPLWFRQLEQKF